MKKIMTTTRDSIPPEELSTNLEMESILLQDLSTLAEQVHVATREAASNTYLDMQEFLGIDKALRRLQGEIVNNAAKLTELDKQLDCNWGKLKEIRDDLSYSKKLKERIRERIYNAETEREARLKVLLQNKKELRCQVSRIKELIVKILGNDTSITEMLRIF